jgi:hypothetical protein
MVEKITDYLVRRIQPRPSEGLQGSYDLNTDYTETLLTHARLDSQADLSHRLVAALVSSCSS